MPFDGVRYLCCTDCGEFVVEGESEAHERGCNGTALVCRICGDQVSMAELRDHLVEHNPNAEQFDSEEVRDQFTADKPIEDDREGDNSAFLGCLTGTIKFGPGWDKPLPEKDWEALQ
jgi:hypothetical protein